MKKLIVLGGIVLCLLCLAGGAHASLMFIRCTGEVNPIFGPDGSIKLPQGSFVQIIMSDLRAPGTPDTNGMPIPPTGRDESVIMTCFIGGTPEAKYGPGELYYFCPVVKFNSFVYLRAWNSSTVKGATKYGDSIPEKASSMIYGYKPPSFSTNLDFPVVPGQREMISKAKASSAAKKTKSLPPKRK